MPVVVKIPKPKILFYKQMLGVVRSRRPRLRRRAAAGIFVTQPAAKRRRAAGVSRRRGLRVHGFLFPIRHETYQLSVVSSFMSVLMQLFVILIILISTCFEI